MNTSMHERITAELARLQQRCDSRLAALKLYVAETRHPNVSGLADAMNDWQQAVAALDAARTIAAMAGVPWIGAGAS